MELKTVIANLNNTISGKEFLLSSLQKEQLSNTSRSGSMVIGTTIKFLTIIIDELKRIRDDLLKIK